MTVDEKLLADDTRARELALDVSRSFIVQAPAGSGKTELLIQRYLALLGSVEHPEEVLAITFTRKAAAEMQIRVLEALQRAVTGEEPEASHERVTAAAARTVLERDREFGWNLLTHTRRLRIQTLDSLNAMIARARPLTGAGGAAGNSIIADAEMYALYRNAAALTFDQLTEEDDFRDATELVLEHLDNYTGLYVEYLARMLATRDQWLPFVGSGSLGPEEADLLRERFDRSLEGVVSAHLARLVASIPEDVRTSLPPLAAYAAVCLEEAGRGEAAICRLAEGASFTDVAAASLPCWLGLADLLLTGQGTWRKQVNKNLGFPAGDDGQKKLMHGLLESLSGHETLRELLCGLRTLPPVDYSDEQWRVLVALFRLLPLTVMELKRLFAERGVSDHIEVALGAADALGTADEPGDVALLLDYQIRHLLVDEMQDTSSAQYRMLEALTGGWVRGDGRTLFCVGDPMQSIYRFRNAEVGQFLLAQKAGIGSVDLETLTLRRNFRSGEKLVQWFNDVFPNVLAATDDPQQSAVSYSAAVSVPAHAAQGRCVVYPLFDSDTDEEADAGFGIIKETLDEYPGDDMAVLVRSRTHLPPLLSRLRKAGIAYRAIEIDRLTDLPEIIDVLALTRAMVHQGDRLAWLAILRGPWVGLHWTDLHAIVCNDAQRTIWELLNDNDRVARLSDEGREAVGRFLENAHVLFDGYRSRSLRERVERAWLSLGGPAVLDETHVVQNVYRYLDVIEKIEVAGSLPDVAELEAALDEEHVSSDVDARLQVMTMHRAKGLQFDHVLLFGLGHVPRPPDTAVLSWIDIPDEHGRPQKIISPIGPRADLERDPLHKYIATEDARKDANELGRLLYVACTRARKSLHLLGHARILKSGMRPVRRSLLHLLWPAVRGEYEAATEAAEDGDGYGAGDGWVLPVLRHLEPAWAVPDAPELLRCRVQPRPVDESAPVDYYWVGAGARLAGTIVHRWIQRATEGRITLLPGNLQALRPVTQRWLREMGIASEAQAPIATRVEDALRGISEDERGRWLLEGDGHAELSLSGVVHGRVESIIIDRVRIGADGTHWIVDYKTSSHEGGRLEDFLQAESDRYRPQLRKYADIYRNYSGADVRCALYFPLLQQFVEVSV
ncbi:MAG: UvrD-helicase domain-containing protein [Woeseiaceae bacterium]|nr:UvrD-helicase domain-containing protein [Woeseiaceae bacterium]